MTNVILLVVSSLKLLQFRGLDDFDDRTARDGFIHVTFCSVAILVWIRSLSIIIPVYPRLGPLLNTIFKMVADVVAFMFPYIVILSGFATMLTGVYADSVVDYQSW